MYYKYSDHRNRTLRLKPWNRIRMRCDVQNWAQTIERDLLDVEETMRRAEEEAEREGSAQGGGARRGWFCVGERLEASV